MTPQKPRVGFDGDKEVSFEEKPTRLSKAQKEALERVRDKGPHAWARGKGRAGGAVARMFERMVVAGLVSGPPYEITEAGRAALTRESEGA